MISAEDFKDFVDNQKCDDCPIKLACTYNEYEIDGPSICSLISDHNEPD